MTTPPSVLAYRRRQKKAGMRWVGMWIHKSLVVRARQWVAREEEARQSRPESGT